MKRLIRHHKNFQGKCPSGKRWLRKHLLQNSSWWKSTKEIIVCEKRLEKCFFRKKILWDQLLWTKVSRKIIKRRKFLALTYQRNSMFKRKVEQKKFFGEKSFVKIVQRTFSLQYNAIYFTINWIKQIVDCWIVFDNSQPIQRTISFDCIWRIFFYK